MKSVGAILVFALICVVSAGAYLASRPVLVHRVSPKLDETVLILAGLLALAVVWWFVSGRRWAIALLGWLVLAVILLFYGGAVWLAFRVAHKRAAIDEVSGLEKSPGSWKT